MGKRSSIILYVTSLVAMVTLAWGVQWKAEKRDGEIQVLKQIDLPAIESSESIGDERRGQTPQVMEDTAASYDNAFRCTVYYTPVESGIIEDRGYDVTPTTKPGLNGKKFPSDFLKAVALEGFGRMSVPVDGRNYIQCLRGRWSYASQPLDCRGQPLKPRQSCAISAAHDLIRPSARFRIRAKGMSPEFTAARWQVTDTGSGLDPKHLDLYWGEDEPLGPDRQLSRPRGMPHPIARPLILVLR